MLRRSILSGAAASLLTSSPSLSLTNPIVLRLGFGTVSNSQLGLGAFAFAKWVNEHCGGRIRVELYPAGAAGNELDLLQDIRAGAFEMSYGISASFCDIVPSLAILDVPFLFRDIAHARAVLDGRIGQDSLALLEPQGVVGLAWGENGLRHITTRNTPVRSPKDLAGIKIRVPQTEIMVNVFKAFGAEARSLGFQGLYAALASGEFDAQENPLSIIKGAAFDKVQKYLCLTGHVYSAAMLMISKRAYDALGEQDRLVLRRAAVECARASRVAGDESQKNDVDELRRRGMTVVADVDQAAFVAALAGMQGSFAQQFGQDRLDAIRSFKQ